MCCLLGNDNNGVLSLVGCLVVLDSVRVLIYGWMVGYIC